MVSLAQPPCQDGAEMEVNSSIPIYYAGIVDHGFSSRQALGSSLVTQLSPYQRSPLPLVVDERSRSRRHERYAPWPIWSYWTSSKRVHDCIAKLGSSKSFSYRLMGHSFPISGKKGGYPWHQTMAIRLSCPPFSCPQDTTRADPAPRSDNGVAFPPFHICCAV